MVSKQERERLRSAFVALFVKQGESQAEAEKLADAAVSGVAEDADTSGEVTEAKRGKLETVELHEVGSIVGRVQR